MISLATEALDIAAEGFGAASRFDTAGIEAVSDWMIGNQAKAEELMSKYVETRLSCLVPEGEA